MVCVWGNIWVYVGVLRLVCVWGRRILPEVSGTGGELVRGVGELLGCGPVGHGGQHATRRADHVPARLTW